MVLTITFMPMTPSYYITFDLSDPSIAIEKTNLCIYDIRIWMITNKLKINDSKTEFL